MGFDRLVSYPIALAQQLAPIAAFATFIIPILLVQGMVANPSDLPDYIARRLERVIATTGYRVAIEEVDQLEFDSEVGCASKDSPIHHIRYRSGFRDHAHHFIFTSLAKIERFFAAPPEDRYVPLVDVNGRLPADEELELARGLPHTPARLIAEVSNRLYVGLARQVLSFPIDLRVERETHAQVPEHREKQSAYLRRQLADFEEHFSPVIAAVSPPKAYAASTAMNRAFAEAWSRLAGERPSRTVRYSPHRRAGLRLLELLDAVQEPGHVGDRRAQDAWAKELGLQGVWEWSPARN